MLNLYYGRERIQKEKFVYDQIGARRGDNNGTGVSVSPVLVIVPDQYTLDAERQALHYLKRKSLMGIEIFSMSRLAHTVLKELGGDRRTFINPYGRQMLLTQIAEERKEDLQVYRGTVSKHSFVAQANDFISELKLYGIDPDGVREVRDHLPQEGLLSRKLSDLLLLYEEYQTKIQGKYTDSEDYIDLFLERMEKSNRIHGAQVWVYGFDTFSPKSLRVLRGMMNVAGEVNVVLTYDKNCPDEELFDLTAKVMQKLEHAAHEADCPVGTIGAIGPEYERRAQDWAPGIAHVERELYSVAPRPAEDSTGVTLCEAASIYNEAESAAAFILKLLREDHYHYRDIVVICNDQASRPLIYRIFREYGIEPFLDNKRRMLNSNPAIFLVSLLQTVTNRYRTSDVMRTLKTGFTNLTQDEVEQLENYGIKYRVQGTMWKHPFQRGEKEYGEEGLAALETLRSRAMEDFLGLELLVRESKTNRDFVTGFYEYLCGPLQLETHLQTIMERQVQNGAEEQAEETKQIFTKILEIFDQIVELIGEETFRPKEFQEVLRAGLSGIEIGLLPLTVDDLMIGALQRTRVAQPKAMVILGANEGVLPAREDNKGMFSPEERRQLAEGEYELCKLDHERFAEERMAIYRNMSRPTEHLWISYSVGDKSGEGIQPSEIVETLREIFPNLTVQQDVNNRKNPMELIGGRQSTLRHMVEAMALETKKTTGKAISGQVSPVWHQVENWYREHDRAEMDGLRRTLCFDNRPEHLTERHSQSLFKTDRDGDLVLSPSKLETYGGCPFGYFVRYGLKPEERRVYEVGNRELGDVYHGCLMRVTAQLSRNHTWETVTQEEAREMVRKAIDEETEGYREELFTFGKREEYQAKRTEETCFKSVWALIQHARAGQIEDSRFELGFGKGRALDPITISVGDQKVFVEGRIDRMDQLPEQRMKIIDYKSSNRTLNADEVRAGYRLQLMLYMKAAQGGGQKPAGVFYFHIFTPKAKIDKSPKAKAQTEEQIAAGIEKQLRKGFWMNGILVDDQKVKESLDKDYAEGDAACAIHLKNKGTEGTTECILMSEEEFGELQQDLDGAVEKLVSKMLGGEIEINPVKAKGGTACEFCESKSVCRFDQDFSGCHYRRIRKAQPLKSDPKKQ